VAEGGQDAGRAAQGEREEQRAGAEREGHRHAEADQLGDRAVGVAKGRPQVAAQDVAEVADVLARQWLVQVVPRLYVGADLRREGPLQVERAARRHPHDEEGDGDDDQQDRRHAGETPGEIARHGPIISRC
jgi:hypothetical protein